MEFIIRFVVRNVCWEATRENSGQHPSCHRARGPPTTIAFSPSGKFLAMTIMDGSAFPPDSPFYHDGGRVAVHAVKGVHLSKVAEAKIGHWSQGLVWARNGKHILVENMVEKDVMVFDFDGKAVQDTGKRAALKGGGAALRTATNP